VATITKNASSNWKAFVRKSGWPAAIKTFRTKRDAEDWARRVEDEMVRGVYIDRTPSERATLRTALMRYLAEVSPTKDIGAAEREESTAKPILDTLGSYSLAAITPPLIADYRDRRMATSSPKTGRLLSAGAVSLELALPFPSLRRRHSGMGYWLTAEPGGAGAQARGAPDVATVGYERRKAVMRAITHTFGSINFR